MRFQIMPSWLQAPRVFVLFVCAVLPLMGFGMLAEEVMENERILFDNPVLLFMHEHASPFMDSMMLASSRAGSMLVLLPFFFLVAVWLYRERERNQFIFWLLAVAGSELINLLAKLSFQRARPDLWPSISPESTYSFPSGHAMASMAVAAAVISLLWQKARWRNAALLVGIPYVVIVGLSRIYLGVHYPSDVLAGWMASLVWVTGLTVLLVPRFPNSAYSGHRDR